MKREAGIVLHATWMRYFGDRQLCFYGEDCEKEIIGIKPDYNYFGGKPHLFAASNQQLLEALKKTFGRPVSQCQYLRLILPSRDQYSPLPSPEYGYQDPKLNTTEEVCMEDWLLPCHNPSIGRAMKMLLRMREDQEGVIIGTSIWFWRALSIFAVKLIAAGYCAPSRNGWQIFIPEAVMEEYRQFLLSAPKNLLAAYHSWSTGDLDSVLREFLNECAREFAEPHFRKTGSYQKASSTHLKNNRISSEEWGRRLGGDLRGLEKRGIPKQIKNWLGEEDGNSTELLITLDEPADDEKWHVEYSIRTPSCDIPLKELGEREDECYLLTGDLVHKTQHYRSLAERIFPPLARGSRYLTNDEVVELITKKGSALLASGIILDLPSWCGRGIIKPSITIKINDGTSFITLSDLLDFDWTVSIGDGLELSPEEFSRLVEEKRSLVRVKDRFLLISPDDLAIAAKTIPKKGRLTLAEAMQFNKGDELDGWESTKVNFPADLEKRIRKLFSLEELMPIEHPIGFLGELRHYQQYGAGWMMLLDGLGFGGCLADDMGLGKTVQTIAYLCAKKEREGKIHPVLIICPMSVLGTWFREFGKFAPDLRCRIHHGTDRHRAGELSIQSGECDIILTSYALLVRDLEIFSKYHWETIILDEAQNIKNPGSKQSRAARRLRSKSRFALTGTPVENRLHELWSIMDFLNPGYLGSAEQFRKKFATPIEKGSDERKRLLLKRLISPFLLRRMKTDKEIINDLPEKMETKIYCQFSPQQAAAYQAVVDSLVHDLGTLQGIAKRGRILATLTKLKQVCDHPDLLKKSDHLTAGSSKKIARLYEIITEILDNGEKALIFTQFARFGEMLTEDLKKEFNLPVLFLSGKTPRKQREQMIHTFQESGGPPLFVLSLRAGGTGITLTHATHVIHLDRWWNPAVESQATDRTYRIGQQENVFVHLMISEGTIEEKIDALLEDKKRVAEAVIGSGEDWIGELSDEELKELLHLELRGA